MNSTNPDSQTDSTKVEIRDQITLSVKSGFYSKEDILENITEMFEEEEDLDEDWVEKEIQRQYDQRVLEQNNWEKVTDFDRLALAFDKFNSSGIIALHNAGTTSQDGESDTWEIHEKLKTKGITTRGYCFYHGQDLERVVEGENLYLAFGDFADDKKTAVEIGNEIINVLREHGFKTSWNGSIESRIEVVGIKWQERFGNENCSYERAVRLLEKR